jgi:foldase protein PrsA
LSEEEISAMGIRYETIEELYTEYALADKVYDEIIRDINPEISDDEARTITVQDIFLYTVKKDKEGKPVPYSEEDKQHIYEKAQEIRQMAVSGEYDFTELAVQYSEDEVISCSFGKGEMEKPFEEAAFQLETDEISEVIETDSGYHIIKCLNTFNREETDANKLSIVEKRRKEAFGQEYDVFVDSLARQLNKKLLDQITLIHDPDVDTSDFFRVYEKYFPRAE